MATIKDALRSVEEDESYRHIVSISGGKDSAALAIYLKERYPTIPAEYVFCDTGSELPETYDYLQRLEALLGQPIARLSALDRLGVRRKSTRTPFDIWLNEVYGGFLPNPRSRWCTRALKIEPFEAYVGQDSAFSYIGIRGDESREGYRASKPPVISQRRNIIPVYPFKDDRLGLQDIQQILRRAGIGFPDYYRWRSRSGCYFCFYQQLGEWQRLAKEHPDLYEKAKKYEKTDGNRPFTWIEGRTLSEIVAMPPRPLPDADNTEGCAVCHL